MRLVLPYPPSVNNLYATFKGRRILSREGRAYHESVGAAALMQKAFKFAFDPAARLGYELTIYPPDRRKRDLSNTIKAVEDALTQCGVWPDDSQVDSIKVRRLETVKGGRAEIFIEALPPTA